MLTVFNFLWRFLQRIFFDHELVLILAGSGELILNSERCPYQPHDLLFIPPFLPHEFPTPARPEGEHVAIHFDFSPQIAGMDSELEQRVPYEIRLAQSLHIPRRQFAPPGGSLESALLNLVREQSSPDPLAGLRTTSQMFLVLAQVICLEGVGQELVPVSAAAAKNRARVERVLAFLHAHLRQPMTADLLAQIADMSVSRMNAVFKQETGYSPLEYVRRMRVAQARRLLAEPELSVKEIAAQTGFEDSFHFSKVFRRLDGLSPTHYRDAVLASRTRLSETDIG